jgi:hypothetical protein
MDPTPKDVPAEGAQPRNRLSASQLADEAGVELEYVQRLVQADALHPDGNGFHATGDVLQIRLFQAMAESGIDLDDVAWAIRDAGMPLHRVSEM